MCYIKCNLIKAVLISIAFCFLGEAKSQTFSKKVDNSLTSVHLHIMNEPFGYQTISIGYDSINGELKMPTTIKSYDWEGDILSSKVYCFDNRWWNPNSDCNARLNDSTTVFMAIEFESFIDTMYNTLVWLNNDGDTLQTKRFHSPYHIGGNTDTYHFVPTTVTTSDNGQFIYYVSQIVDYPPIQNNFLIKKLTAQGEEVWTYVNPIGSIYYYSCSAIAYFENQLWFVAQASGGEGNYNKLKSLNDTTGLVDYDVEHNASSFPLGAAADMLVDNQGYTVTTGGGTVNNIVPYTFKVDFAGDYLWYTAPDGENAPQQMSDHLCKSPDGGYVSCSVKYDEQINPEDPNDSSSNNTSEKIWLWKVDSEGVFQWQRFYEYLSFDSGYFYLNNIAHDMKATPDGGYIMAGEATASCLQWPECDDFTQQGWLLKVDGCGCLVPGCDLDCVVGVEEIANNEEQNGWFLVGPNPARDMLNVYINKISNVQLSTLNIQVHNLAGKLVRSFDLKHDDTTYMIDTTSLAAGQYVVSLVSEGVVLQTEKVVIAK